MRLLKPKKLYVFASALVVVASIFFVYGLNKFGADLGLVGQEPAEKIPLDSKEDLIKKFSVKPIKSTQMMEEVVVVKDGNVVGEQQ